MVSQSNDHIKISPIFIKISQLTISLFIADSGVKAAFCSMLIIPDVVTDALYSILLFPHRRALSKIVS